MQICCEWVCLSAKGKQGETTEIQSCLAMKKTLARSRVISALEELTVQSYPTAHSRQHSSLATHTPTLGVLHFLHSFIRTWSPGKQISYVVNDDTPGAMSFNLLISSFFLFFFFRNSLLFFSFLFKKFLIGVQLINNVVLVSGVQQQWFSYTYTRIYSFSFPISVITEY